MKSIHKLQQHMARLAALAVLSLTIIGSCSSNNTLSSSADTGICGTPTVTPCPQQVSILVTNATAFTAVMLFDSHNYPIIPSGGSYTFIACPGIHNISMAGICPPGFSGTCAQCYSMNYNPLYPYCGRAFTCRTSDLAAGSYTINIIQTVSPIGCAGEIDWNCL